MKKVLRFKTNINCGGCIKAVTPALNKLAGEKNWEVDISDQEKTLSVISETLNPQDVMQTIRAAGFNIETVNK